MGDFNLKNKARSEKLKRLNIMALLDRSIFVKILCPPKDSLSYENIKNRLKRLEIEKTPERIASYKFLIMVVTFFILLVLNFSYINSENNKVIHGESTLSFSTMDSNENNAEKLYQSIMQETIKKYDYKNLINNGQYQELVNSIRRVEESMSISDNSGDITKAVFDKFIGLQNNKVHLQNILVFILISFISSSLVNVYLAVLTNIKDNEIYKEFKTLELLTIILIKNTDISVKRLLEIHYQRSKILKPYYKKCLATYPAKKEEAINELMRSVGNESFSEFMSLILDNMKGDKDVNNKLLEANKNLGYELDEEDYIKRLSGVSKIFTIISFPSWILAILLLFVPVFVSIKFNL
jgi:hypothetical protein